MQNRNSINEEWKPIEGFEGRYEISNHGRVKSVEREIKIFGRSIRRIPEKIMYHVIHNNGYKVVWLRKPKQHIKFFIHVLVARAFIPNPDEKPVVNHIDCDKENCHVSNLEWMTFSENTKYYYQKKKEEEVDEMPF